MPQVTPDFAGSGLVNLVAELEGNLIGSAPLPGLSDPGIPGADGYVLLVLDGLGSRQLGHPAAAGLEESRIRSLTAGFPTTTTSSMATLITGLPPAAHGVIGHIMHLPGVATTVNVLKWITPSGEPVDHDHAAVLPHPNLWERLAGSGVEPITVQPGPFLDSPLSRMLYRGCRFEPAWSPEELVEATSDLAGPGRLIITYLPNVDVAAHVSGQDSEAYRDALSQAVAIWEGLARRLPPEVGLVGTADHGHIDYRSRDKVLIRDPRYERLRFFGDPRSMYVTGPTKLIEELADETGAEIVDRDILRRWLGPGVPHPQLEERLGDRLLLAPAGKVLLPRPFDKRLIGYHGGLEPEEMLVPLLVRA